jgi:hypothetical protein
VPVVDIRAEESGGTIYECTEEWENLLETLRDIAFESCPCVENCGTGGTGGSGGSVGDEYCARHTLFSHTCFPAPEFGEDVTVAIDASAITYTMPVGGLQEPGLSFAVGATGTLNGTTGTGTGDPITADSGAAGCTAPEARLRFDIMFEDSTLAAYDGMINVDFTLDPNCGSSICFASANVSGTKGPCP